jgi:glycosyltransferase involved in cell wall biosynthesis
MDVLYICSPALLDYSAEQINDLKTHVNLHVVVVVFLSSPNHSIFKLKNDHKIVTGIYTFAEIKDKIENVFLFEEYFKKCKSINFVFFSPKFGINIFITNLKILNLCKSINPKIIHFDDISFRLLLFALLIRNKKIVLNVHDPLSHSGEKKMITNSIRSVLFKRISAFCTFSNFSYTQFKNIYSPKAHLLELKLIPYKSYLLFDKKEVIGINKVPNEKVLLFFGRISEYKGIDELLLTFAKLKNKFSNIKLVIAGTGAYNYHIPQELIGSSSLIILNRFIFQNEIQSIFDQADVLICPYRDATQSGVLMTAAVFGIPSIVSNVGALPEYIVEGENGYVYDINDMFGLENEILKFISNGIPSNRTSIYKGKNVANNNSKLLIDVYSKILIDS